MLGVGCWAEGSLRALRAGLTGTLGKGSGTLGKGTLRSTNIFKEWETRTVDGWLKLLYDVDRIPVEEVQHLNTLLSKVCFEFVAALLSSPPPAPSGADGLWFARLIG